MKNTLNYNYFTGTLLYAFIRSLLKIVDSSKLTDGLLKTLITKVETAFANFSKGLEYDAKDPLSGEAAQKDATRDAYYCGMKNYIKSFLNSPVTAKAETAEKLVAVIRKYGWSAERLNYEDETTAIVKCIDDLTGNYAAEIAELGLQDLWLTPLTEAQEAFETIQNQRIANGATELASMSQYRTPMVKALRTFLGSIETYAENTDDATILAYEAEIDELIGQTMAKLKAASNRNDNDSDATSTESSTS